VSRVKFPHETNLLTGQSSIPGTTSTLKFFCGPSSPQYGRQIRVVPKTASGQIPACTWRISFLRMPNTFLYCDGVDTSTPCRAYADDSAACGYLLWLVAYYRWLLGGSDVCGRYGRRRELRGLRQALPLRKRRARPQHVLNRAHHPPFFFSIMHK
jgi:hypothetical protein